MRNLSTVLIILVRKLIECVFDLITWNVEYITFISFSHNVWILSQFISINGKEQQLREFIINPRGIVVSIIVWVVKPIEMWGEWIQVNEFLSILKGRIRVFVANEGIGRSLCHIHVDCTDWQHHWNLIPSRRCNQWVSWSPSIGHHYMCHIQQVNNFCK